MSKKVKQEPVTTQWVMPAWAIRWGPTAVDLYRYLSEAYAREMGLEIRWGKDAEVVG